MKKMVSLFLALVICLSASTTAFAATAQRNDEPTVVVLENQTRAEETTWYYRIIDNSIVQKRLWSITYGYWKTDWITIGYVDPNP